jgi:hypothetical protein
MMGILPCDYMTFFEDIDVAKVMITTHVKDLLVFYNLLNELTAYVKGKGGNMSTLALIVFLHIDVFFSQLQVLGLKDMFWRCI